MCQCLEKWECSSSLFEDGSLRTSLSSGINSPSASWNLNIYCSFICCYVSSPPITKAPLHRLLKIKWKVGKSISAASCLWRQRNSLEGPKSCIGVAALWKTCLNANKRDNCQKSKQVLGGWCYELGHVLFCIYIYILYGYVVDIPVFLLSCQQRSNTSIGFVLGPVWLGSGWGQVPTKAALSLFSSDAQGRGNIAKGLWVEVRTGKSLSSC